MRNLEKDGSITEECPKCGGSKYVRNSDNNIHETCAKCNGVGYFTIAPAGSKVTVAKAEAPQ